MKNFETIHFNGMDANVTELTEILPKVGFRPLTSATPDDMPVGSVVSLYNRNTNVLVTIVICEHLHGLQRGFTYMLYNDLNHCPDVEFQNMAHIPENLLYKVMLQLPSADPNPTAELLKASLAMAGFSPMDEATPEDLPQGCVALLAGPSGTITPVIVRALSMENRRFLYLCQGTVAGHWEGAVIMDHLKPFKNYSYRVIS